MDTTQLDQRLPLRNASHADVEHYGVDIPMRYSECYAKLKDGRIVEEGSHQVLLEGDGLYAHLHQLQFQT